MKRIPLSFFWKALTALLPITPNLASAAPIQPCPLMDRGPVRMVTLSDDGTKQHLIRFTVVGFTFSPRQNIWLLSARTKFEFDQGRGEYRVFYGNENYFIANGSRQFRFVIELFGNKEFILNVECPNEMRLAQGSYEITLQNRVTESGTVRFFAANKPSPGPLSELRPERSEDASEPTQSLE